MEPAPEVHVSSNVCFPPYPIQFHYLCNLVTGCIRPETVDRLNPGDGGGQYDSSGGDGGNGNPAGSKCSGFVNLS